MEERMIDEEYGRKIRLKRTKTGEVDVVDELSEGAEATETLEETEEIAFEMPVQEEEDDEDLVGLSPEEALALRKKKAEAARLQKEEYDAECARGQQFLDEGNFAEAEKSFEKALLLDRLATAASVGYWRAKTENFVNPDALVGEYAEASIESLEYDLGVDAVDIIKREHKAQLQSRYDELKAEEAPLTERVEAATVRRRTILKNRFIKAWAYFSAVVIPLVVLLVWTGIFARQIFTLDGEGYITWTIVTGAVAFLFFIAFIPVTNKLINANRMRKANERLDSTEEGARLVEVRDYITIYENLLDLVPSMKSTEETDE